LNLLIKHQDENRLNILRYRREEFFAALKKLYFEMLNENLPIYGVQAAKLKEFSTSKKDMKAGNEYQPNEQHRIRSEDIYKPKTGSDLNSSGASGT
jgi:hypothetical protein